MGNTDYQGFSIVTTNVNRASGSAGPCIFGIYKRCRSIHRDERQFADKHAALAAARAWINAATHHAVAVHGGYGNIASGFNIRENPG
jgi:hypothetical protein